MNKTFIIATALMAAALTGILSTTSSAFAQIVSESEQEAESDQEIVASGESTNVECAALNLPGSAPPAPPSGESTSFECANLTLPDSAPPPPPTFLPPSLP